MEGCQQIQELHQTNNFCCRFDQSNPTGLLGFSSCSCCAKGGDGANGSCFLASDQLIYLDYYYYPSAYQTSSSSSHSSQVSMDGEWSPNNFLNSNNNMQANSTRKFSDEHQQEQQPWYGTNVVQSTTDDFDPYTYGQFEAVELTTSSILARSDEQYSMPQFDHHHHQLGNPNDHDQSFFPTSTKQQTILKSSKASAVKRKNQAKKKSEHNIEKRARTATNSSPGNSYNNKIGKEKMGNRISTLQRLVSPFGKADTASVLSECIEYIRFLHEQVSALSSTSYVTKNGAQMQHFQDLDECFYDDCVSRSGSETGLRGRGLCIVPISSTFSLNHEIPTDCWTPTLSGSRSDHNLQN